MDEKSKIEDVELAENPDQYAGLSLEDAEFMRSYEGKRGKQVVRKVFQLVFWSCAEAYWDDRSI